MNPAFCQEFHFFCEQEQLQNHATLDKNPYRVYGTLKVAVNTIVPRSPFFCFSYPQNTDCYTGFYGDKILYKNHDLTQDFPNKILFHFLWEQNLEQNLPKIFRWPEMSSLGKILAQDFQMMAVTKILMRPENQLRRFFPWGISRKHLKHKTHTVTTMQR